MKWNQIWWGTMLVCQTAVLSGCTSVLWDKNTFARAYEPAQPANLRLFYSDQEQDVLVQYDEARDGQAPIRHRAYYADRNSERVNNRHKPRFTSPPDGRNLHPIPITSVPGTSAPPSLRGLCATSPREGDSFTLYSNGEALESYILPKYVGASRRVKQVLLTPFAITIDCTIVGAFIAYYWGPYALSALEGKSL
jgi:hypothetical protein